MTAVRINSLSVPHIIRNGTEDSVILDCDYSIDDNEKLGLVVKWYFNDQQVYQWIPNEKPIILGVLKGKVSLDDQADVDDEYKVKRALKIMRPTTELSGKCSEILIIYMQSEPYVLVSTPAFLFLCICRQLDL